MKKFLSHFTQSRCNRFHSVLLLQVILSEAASSLKNFEPECYLTKKGIHHTFLLVNLKNFWGQLFYRIPSGDASVPFRHFEVYQNSQSGYSWPCADQNIIIWLTVKYRPVTSSRSEQFHKLDIPEKIGAFLGKFLWWGPLLSRYSYWNKTETLKFPLSLSYFSGKLFSTADVSVSWSFVVFQVFNSLIGKLCCIIFQRLLLKGTVT